MVAAAVMLAAAVAARAGRMMERGRHAVPATLQKLLQVDATTAPLLLPVLLLLLVLLLVVVV